MAASDIINTIVSGGLGAAIASVVIALINTFSKKGESRASAADLVTNAAGGLIDRLNQDNKDLRSENRSLREAILTLTDVIDEIVDDLPIDNETTDSLKTKLRHANLEAKKVV